MDIKEKVKAFLENEISNTHSSEIIKESTSLIGGGYIDSISTLQLVDFLEKEFDIEFEAHEVDRDYLDNLDLIEKFVLSKMNQ